MRTYREWNPEASPLKAGFYLLGHFVGGLIVGLGLLELVDLLFGL